MKKILITGATGLIGYDVVKVLKKVQEYEVYTTCHNYMFKDKTDSLQIDLENTSIESLQIKFDCIVHCAARIPDYIHSDKEVAIINRDIDDNVISYCAINKCKLIYISGTSVYGTDNKRLLTEQTKINTESEYVYEKRNSEIKIEKECKLYCILRVSSPYGPRQKSNTVLKKFIEAAYLGENIYYFGTGKRSQNFIDVRDVARAVLMCIDYKGVGIFNIASKESTSMRELANLVSKMGKIEFDKNSSVYAGNTFDTQENVRINLDISLAENILGWKPQIELKEGVQYWMQAMKGEEL